MPAISCSWSQLWMSSVMLIISRICVRWKLSRAAKHTHQNIFILARTSIAHQNVASNIASYTIAFAFMIGHNENLELQHKPCRILEASYTKIWRKRYKQIFGKKQCSKPVYCKSASQTKSMKSGMISAYASTWVLILPFKKVKVTCTRRYNHRNS